MNWHHLTLAAAVMAFCADATAGTRTDKSFARATSVETGKHYVDFLARPTQYFGHSYVQVGTLDRNGNARPTATAGFYPKSSKSVFGAPGVVTATGADLKSAPSVRYRVAVSERTYRKTTALIKDMPQSFQRYDLVRRNCNHLMGRVAGQIGLAVPGDYADLPENYVRSMQSANGGRASASWR